MAPSPPIDTQGSPATALLPPVQVVRPGRTDSVQVAPPSCETVTTFPSSPAPRSWIQAATSSRGFPGLTAIDGSPGLSCPVGCKPQVACTGLGWLMIRGGLGVGAGLGRTDASLWQPARSSAAISPPAALSARARPAPHRPRRSQQTSPGG